MFLDPSSIINQLNLEPGMHVADLGAGSGFYTLALAPKVSPNGRIYAVEVQRELLARIGEEAKRAHITNVDILWGNIEHVGGTKIRESLIDFALASNVLFQVEDKESFVKEVHRILKSGGNVLVVDWTASFGGLGPEPTAVVTETGARSLFEKNGFSFVRNITAGTNHYGIILKKV